MLQLATVCAFRRYVLSPPPDWDLLPVPLPCSLARSSYGGLRRGDVDDLFTCSPNATFEFRLHLTHKLILVDSSLLRSSTSGSQLLTRDRIVDLNPPAFSISVSIALPFGGDGRVGHEVAARRMDIEMTT